jgi:hypothetical protein
MKSRREFEQLRGVKKQPALIREYPNIAGAYNDESHSACASACEEWCGLFIRSISA